MNEEWKEVVGYEGLYMVSNFGNVKSIDRVVIGRDGVKYPFIGKIKRLQL